MNKSAILACSQLSKSFFDGNQSIDVLQGIDLAIYPGDTVSIMGTSGVGKSTLLHLLGGLDKPSSGEVCIQGLSWAALNERKRCQLRNQYLGFVYQFHHLLPEFSALENVALPLLLSHETVKEAKSKAVDILQQVGLGMRLQHKPAELSGGERQRVAIARALVNRPLCVVADEPTGNLDETTAGQLFELLLALNSSLKTALVIVTHDPVLAAKMKRQLKLKAGHLEPIPS